MPLGCGPADTGIVTTVCNSHCGGACVLRVHVKDGVVTRIETDDGEDEPQLRACAKGRAHRQRLYAPDRLRFPLKRTGRRGEGAYERVSWDEALDTVARELQRVRAACGPEAVLLIASGGDLTLLHGARVIKRMLVMSGGCSGHWGAASNQQCVTACFATYGSLKTLSTRDDLLNSRLIIMWGWDPASTIQGTNTSWYLAQAKEAGIKIVSVDPWYTDSAATFASEWIPVRPGTDCAMLVAMAYVIVSEGLQDQDFLDRHTFGFGEFRDYVLGTEDGIPKTPVWAEAITGVPAGTISRLAREYATAGPAALIAGIAPGRTAYGEQYHRAAMTLSAMTGNIGRHGGSAAGRSWAFRRGGHPLLEESRGVDLPVNSVEDEAQVKDAFPPHYGIAGGYARLSTFDISDAILRGKAGGHPADYKLAFIVNSNFINQTADAAKAARALRSAEFVVTLEQFLTSTARFADIVLPTTTFLERNDITCCHFAGFYGYAQKVVDPLGEAKSHLEIADLLAARLGVAGWGQRSEQQWLKEIAEGSANIADYEAFKKEHVRRFRLPEPHVAFKKEIEDPEHNPFLTPSGKIEIFSQRLAVLEDPLLPSVPKYIAPWEGPGDPLVAKYPLQLITTHPKLRAHSQFETTPWLKEARFQAVTMNAEDAGVRGIKDGDTVRVFNDRGQTVLPATVTERLMPGVVAIPEGAWFNADEAGVDRGGCPNVLLGDRHSPAWGFVSNTCLVQIEKA